MYKNLVEISVDPEGPVGNLLNTDLVMLDVEDKDVPGKIRVSFFKDGHFREEVFLDISQVTNGE